MKTIFSICFLFFGFHILSAQSSQLTVTTYPSCPDAGEGSASITPSLDLLQQYPDVEEWSMEYENLSTGEYQGPYLLFPPPSLPTLPILLQDLNPGTYEATLYLDRNYECRIDFDFFVDIAQGCACPELLADQIITHNCEADNGNGSIDLILNEFDPNRNIQVSWMPQPPFIPRPTSANALASGTYTAILTDDYGCTEFHSFEVHTLTPLTDLMSSNITPSCSGSSVGAIDMC